VRCHHLSPNLLGADNGLRYLIRGSPDRIKNSACVTRASGGTRFGARSRLFVVGAAGITRRNLPLPRSRWSRIAH
jgi:hypothetical protein